MNMNIIKIKMIELDIKNNELAKILNVNENTISRWLKGKNLNQIEVFLKMILFLDIDINKIMD